MGSEKEAEEKRLEPAEDDTPPYTCDVCFGDDFTEDKITRLDDCRHFLCTSCMKHTIENNIGAGKWEMTCHYRGKKGAGIEPCDRAITDAEVKRIASAQRYCLYQNKVRERKLERDGAMLCPNPKIGGCGGPNVPAKWVYPTKGWTTKRECLFCGYAFCTNVGCRVAAGNPNDEKVDDAFIVTRYANWKKEHAKLTCDQFQLKNAAQALGNNRIKQCPAKWSGVRCQALMQHDQGCNHMKCSTCRHEFCWTCLKPYFTYQTNSQGKGIGCHSSYCATEHRKTGLDFA